MVKRVDAPGARRLVERGAQLVDVLPATVFTEEHLPGAINIPLDTFEPEALGAIDDGTRPIVVYCFDQH